MQEITYVARLAKINHVSVRQIFCLCCVITYKLFKNKTSITIAEFNRLSCEFTEM